ncbi:MAG: hypothetical protein ACYDHY_07620 [Acidiferrobacterales bacterium]
MPKLADVFEDSISNWSSTLRRDEKEKRPEPESFETQEYSEDNEEAIQNTFEVLKQISLDSSWGTQRPSSPAAACGVKLSGNSVVVYFHSYEQQLPGRIAAVQAEAKTALDNYVKFLKAEFKDRSGRALGLKELKDQSDFRVEKVSLNERYMFLTWRTFELK